MASGGWQIFRAYKKKKIKFIALLKIIEIIILIKGGNPIILMYEGIAFYATVIWYFRWFQRWITLNRLHNSHTEWSIQSV